MSEPAWLTIARKELGIHETPGPEATARIVEYDKATTLKATSDEVPWCSSFINWCFRESGVKGTNSAAAISWASWGHEVEYNEAEAGDVVVFEWASGGHHVAFLLEQDDTRVHVLGGNQGGAAAFGGEVDKRWFSKDDVINVRRA